MSDTGWKYATAETANSGWLPWNGYAAWQTEGGANNSCVKEWGDWAYADITTFDFSIPVGQQIDGIEITSRQRAQYAVGAAYGDPWISWNGGANWAQFPWPGGDPPLFTIGNIYQYETCGGPTELCGRVWVLSDFSDANFKLRFRANSGGAVYSYYDVVWIKVYYSPAGGPEVLAGTIAALSSVAVIPSVNAGLVGISVAQSSLSGSMISSVPIIGASHAVSDVRGDMGGTDVPLIGSLASASLVDADLYYLKGLRGVSRSFSYISGLMMPKYSISHNLSHVDQMLDHRLEQFK